MAQLTLQIPVALVQQLDGLSEDVAELEKAIEEGHLPVVEKGVFDKSEGE